jgi:hypothetical protein
MYPISDPELSFGTVAHEWAQEIPQHPDEREVHTHLLHAIWAGRLTVRKPASGEPMLPRELLHIVSLVKSHPGFDIAPTGVTRSSSSEEQSDGSVVVSLHGYIMLPDDPSLWTEQQVRDAIDVLRAQDLEAFTEQFRIGVSCLSVRQNDFAVYCHSAGYPLPNFWFGKHTAKLSISKAAIDCADWLRSLARKPKEHPKRWYREQAYHRFPGLSLRAFDRAWGSVTPQSWRKAGARRRRGISIPPAVD